VAVKTIPSHGVSNEAKQSFMDEIKVMAALRHPNIVLFMAASVKPPKLCIVMEYMTLGSLYEVRRLLPPLQTPTTLRVARALALSLRTFARDMVGFYLDAAKQLSALHQVYIFSGPHVNSGGTCGKRRKNPTSRLRCCRCGRGVFFLAFADEPGCDLVGEEARGVGVHRAGYEAYSGQPLAIAHCSTSAWACVDP
jgi:hypothetical protein